MQFKTLNDNLVAYQYRPSAGPMVVFANSLGSDQSIWDNVIANLGGAIGTLCYDLRGHGASGLTADPYTIDLLSDDLIALLDHLGLDSVILCGVSIGGLIAQAVALKRPSSVRGLVLSNTAARLGTADRWAARINAIAENGLEDIADGIMDLWFASDFQANAPDEWAGHKAMLLRNSALGYSNTCAALRDGDLTADVGNITVPTLCISGDEDRSVPPEITNQLAQKIEGATLKIIKGSGHLPCLDAPLDVAECIEDLIKRVGGGADKITTGMAVRRSVLGNAHVDKAEANATEFDRAFQSLITEGAWGTVWASNAISRRERSMITLALLAALGNFDEIPMHVRASKRTGATEGDIQEAFQHVAIYAGVPRANTALKLAKRTLADMKGEQDG